ncbi:hypothetical protein [Massilia sp. TS11]|uniref:hypothetical protein n=1 Tax=Massilia sp. TS11 TaxID=2908003 RepID=UPI001EDBC6C4|nr:hypothetical protein [Massilia sp. TS11]MCG2585517.1 hypothetical protein [Massilia sp. TS11]
MTTENPFALIKPVAFAAAMLVGSSVSESDPAAWNSGTAYAVGDVRYVSQTQRCYTCLVANTGHRPDFYDEIAIPEWQVSDTEATTWAAGEYLMVGARRRLASTHLVYECQEAHYSRNASTATVTISNATPGVVAWTSHGQAAGTPVVLSTTGTLPAPLVPGVTYYVLSPNTNDFQLAATVGGTAINTTSAGSGTHTATVASTSPELNVGDGQLWVEVGATNKYAAFDNTWGTQTTSRAALVDWNSGTSYAVGDLCKSGGIIYKCLIAHSNAAPASNTGGGSPKWLDVGAASTYALTLAYQPGQVVDSVACLNLLGSSINITCTNGGVPISSRTITLETDIGVYDWYSYFMAPIVAEDDVVETDLLPYYNQIVHVTITGPSTVAIGNIAAGQYVEFGALQLDASASITDYSKKTTDDFGHITVVERPYSKRFEGVVQIDSTFTDQAAAILAQVRATPCVYIGAGNLFSSLIVWGFFKDFQILFKHQEQHFVSISIEGLV